jgi:cell division protein FtsQ
MASPALISHEDLKQRRQALRRRRSLRGLQTSWQLIVAGGCLGGAFWLISLPMWLIKGPRQVRIQGNQLLTTEAIQTLLPLHYPQSLYQVHPHAIAETLESHAPIEQARVVRHVWPPRITIQIQERSPVAIILNNASEASESYQSRTAKVLTPSGLIDANGIWMPASAYQMPEKALAIPKLKVIGIERSGQKTYWPQLYAAVNRSPVSISVIDWSNPKNLILRTELGVVHMGAYGPRFPEQLHMLDRMRQLTDRVKKNQVAYIDLSNPTTPALRMKPKKTTVQIN